MNRAQLDTESGLYSHLGSRNTTWDRMCADFQSTLLGPLLLIGEQNGLFQIMSNRGFITAEELGRETGQSCRYLREWLSALACAGYLLYDPSRDAFAIASESHAETLREAARLHSVLPALYANASAVGAAFGRGTGVPHSLFASDFLRAFDALTRPLYEACLTRQWLQAVPHLCAALGTGGRIADVGCGFGGAALAMAAAYPEAEVCGFDCSQIAVDACMEEARDLGLRNRTRFSLLDVSQGLPERYDLITGLLTIHSMVDPYSALSAIREALQPRGVFVWVELKVADRLEDNLRETPELAQFAYSLGTLYGLTVSLAEGGAGLGMALGPERVRNMGHQAGFRSISEMPASGSPCAVYALGA